MRPHERHGQAFDDRASRRSRYAQHSEGRCTCGSASDARANCIIRNTNPPLTTLVPTFFVRDADTAIALQPFVGLVGHSSWSWWVISHRTIAQEPILTPR